MSKIFDFPTSKKTAKPKKPEQPITYGHIPPDYLVKKCKKARFAFMDFIVHFQPLLSDKNLLLKYEDDPSIFDAAELQLFVEVLKAGIPVIDSLITQKEQMSKKT